LIGGLLALGRKRFKAGPPICERMRLDEFGPDHAKIGRQFAHSLFSLGLLVLWT
jgi:hypothetical protein